MNKILRYAQDDNSIFLRVSGLKFAHMRKGRNPIFSPTDTRKTSIPAPTNGPNRGTPQ